MRMTNTITHGISNVFTDLGYQDAAARQTKTHLALAVNELLEARALNQREIASLLGVPQPKVSALKNYRLDQFSVERLMEFLTALNQDVEIMTPRAMRQAGQAIFRFGGAIGSRDRRSRCR